MTTTSHLSELPLKPNFVPFPPICSTSPSDSPIVFSTHVISFISLSLSYNTQPLFPDPFQVQVAKGCGLHVGEPSVGFMKIAYEGSDLVSFQNTSWWPSPKGGRRAQQVSKLFNQYHVVNLRIRAHIIDICPRFLLGLLDAGKADLQRQGQSCSLPPSILYFALINLQHFLKFRVKRGQEGEG